MSRIRSPGYPGISLPQAIVLAAKLFEKNRHNPIDREAAVKDMGYNTLTGQTTKLLSDLGHFGLVERAGKGGVRVASITARILHPHNPQEKTEALQEAAYTPSLFAEIKDQWPDGYVSENSLRAYLIRRGFASSALQSALKAYADTYALLQQEDATESHRQAAVAGESSTASTGHYETKGADAQMSISRPIALPAPARSGVELMAGERVVFVDEAGASQYLKLVAAGDIDAGSLEALEDFVKRQRRRLSAASATQSTQDDTAA